VKLFLQILLLVLVAAVVALVQSWFVDAPDSSQLEDEWAIGVEEALALRPVIWVDGRGQEAFAQAHFEAAIHLDQDDWDEGLTMLLSRWDPGTTIIVYCDGLGCESSRMTAGRLRQELESESVFWLAGGWPVLRDTGAAP
jgi:hypothetical protein